MVENLNLIDNVNRNLANIYTHARITKFHVKIFLSLIFFVLGIVFLAIGNSKGKGLMILGLCLIILFIPLFALSFFSIGDISKYFSKITLAQFVFFGIIFAILITFFILKLINMKGSPNTGDYVFVYPAKENGSIDLEANPYKLLMDDNKARPFVYDGNKIGFVRGSDLVAESPNEFTYSFWLYVSPRNFNLNQKKWRTVFAKGPTSENSSVSYTRKTPGVYLAPNTNQLIISVACENGPDEGNAIILEDILLGEWFCVTVVLEGRSLDCYVNGKLERSIALTGDVLANNNNLIKGANGFLGKIGFLRFNSVALTPEMVFKKYESENAFINSNAELIQTYVDGEYRKCIKNQ